MIKRLTLIVSLLIIANSAAAQEMYFSISGKGTNVLSGDTRHQYDIWIKPAKDAPNGSLQIFDAGLGGVVDVITNNTGNTTTTFQLFTFDGVYSIAGPSVKAKNAPPTPITQLVTNTEERFKNRWVTLNDISSANEGGYVIRVSTSEGIDINSLNLRVMSDTGDVLSGSSWQIIAIDLSVGLYKSSTSKSYQLKPFLLNGEVSPKLVAAGEEDSKIQKMDSFGDTYTLSEIGRAHV